MSRLTKIKRDPNRFNHMYVGYNRKGKEGRFYHEHNVKHMMHSYRVNQLPLRVKTMCRYIDRLNPKVSLGKNLEKMRSTHPFYESWYCLRILAYGSKEEKLKLKRVHKVKPDSY